MWQHFINLLRKAWALLFTSLGTTPLAVAVFTVAVPALCFAFYVLVVWLGRGERTGAALMSVLRESTRLPAIIALAVTLLAWAVLFGCSIVLAIYGDHQDLVSTVNTVTIDRDSLKHTVSDQQQIVHQRDNEIADLKRQLESRLHRPLVTPIIVGAPAAVPSFPALRNDQRDLLVQKLREAPANSSVLIGAADAGDAASQDFASLLTRWFSLAGWNLFHQEVVVQQISP